MNHINQTHINYQTIVFLLTYEISPAISPVWSLTLGIGNFFFIFWTSENLQSIKLEIFNILKFSNKEGFKTKLETRLASTLLGPPWSGPPC
jgi:hypothetical protein